MRHSGHIRRRSPGSWEVRYSRGVDPATGKRRIATTTVRGDRKAAERELRRLLREVDTGEHVDPTRLNVRAWLAKCSPRRKVRQGMFSWGFGVRCWCPRIRGPS